MKNFTKKKIVGIVILCASLIIAFVLTYKNTNQVVKETVQGEKYDITKEMEIAKEKYTLTNQATTISSGNVNKEAISLVFEETASKETMTAILAVLEEYGIKATFFVTGNECAEQEEIVKEIVSKGHLIGNQTVDGTGGKEKLSVEECRKDFVLSAKIIDVITKTKPTYLRCNDTKYTDTILANAKSTGHPSVVIPSKFISYQSFKNQTQVQEYVNNLESGSLLSIKTKSVLSDSEYENKNTLAKDKEAGIIENVTNQEVGIVQVVTWLLESLNNKKEVISLDELTTLQKEYQEVTTTSAVKKTKVQQKEHKDFSTLIAKNNNQQVTPISMFYTTQKAVAYTFKGVSNEKLMHTILNSLDSMQAKATFFVTVEDIEKHRNIILEIISRGHEIGNGGITKDTKILKYSIQEVCQEIYECHQAILSLGVTTNVYMPANGNTNDTIARAVSTINLVEGMEKYELTSPPRTVILSKYAGMTAKEIVKDYFNDTSYLSLRMGDIIYFSLDNTIISDSEKVNLLTEVNNQLIKNGKVRKLIDGEYITKLAPLNYQITSLATIQSTYETKSTNGRYQLVDGVGEVYEDKVEKLQAYNNIAKSYIGNYDQNDWHFDDKELYNKLETTGNIDTQGKPVIFFTFDDWSGDPITQELLDVLDKHNVKASFFVIARNTDLQGGLSNVNPNLLRAIALKGHDIGSHMYDHETLGANDTVVKNSVINSYQVMHRSIGDLAALKPYFRPPQLLITSYGLRHVMESGYQYSISGTNSTGDYQAKSVEEALGVLESEISKEATKTQGTVFVMHFNDQSTYTAKAVDSFLTKNAQGAYGVKYEVAKLSEYLK